MYLTLLKVISKTLNVLSFQSRTATKNENAKPSFVHVENLENTLYYQVHMSENNNSTKHTVRTLAKFLSSVHAYRLVFPQNFSFLYTPTRVATTR